jgi:hypothetical protein
MIRPNFEAVDLIGDTVRVAGRSNDDLTDVVDIRVMLVQEQLIAGGSVEQDRVAGGPVDKLTTVWHVDLPVGNFRAGPAVAFGVETRRENFATFTWVQPVTIK